MWRNTSKHLVIASLMLSLGGCGCFYSLQQVMRGEAFENEWTKRDAQNVTNAPLRNPKSIVVCRSRQCAPAKLSMSREYIYNSLVHLFENNNHQTALICEANAAAHTCTENYLTMPLKVGITPAHMYIDSVNITDVIIGSKNQQINLVLNYNVTYNGQSPDCTPAKAVSFARNVNHIMIEDIGYRCKMTTIGYSTIKTVLAIDYIDLDFGFIGGYYSIGVSGPAYGGGTGYMMLRLPKYTQKLSPVLADPQKSTAQSPAYSRPKQNQQPISANVESQDDAAFTQSGVQIFPLAPQKTAAPLPETEVQTEMEPQPSAEQTAQSSASQTQETAPVTDADKQTDETKVQRPEQPMQIAPTSYSVTSENKLAEELKKANENK